MPLETLSGAMVRAVIFDMDGLMLDTERVGRVAYRLATGALGYQPDDAIYQRAVGRNVRDTERVFAECYGKRFPYCTTTTMTATRADRSRSTGSRRPH